jgi:acetolactate synthase-1/2/3 large subunit
VILPEDLLDEKTDAPLVQPRIAVAPGPRQEDLERLVEMISKAKRPLVWPGGTMQSQAALADLERLAEVWDLPVCNTNKRTHLFDSGHSHYAGHVGIRTPAKLLDQLKKTDLLIALGERLTDTLSQSYTFPTAPDPQVPLVHVWPEASEVGRVWRPAVGLACEPHALVRALLARTAPAVPAERKPWIAGLNEIQKQLSAPVWDDVDDGVNFAAVVCAINPHLTANAAVTVDAGSFATFMFRYLRQRRGQHMLTSVVGSMGAGVPMAVAAALRDPTRQVVAFVGDGGTLMTGNELATARLYGVKPIIIIADNGYYGTIGLHQDVRYPGRPFEAATQLANPDFAQWARSFGAKGITIANESEVPGAIAEAFAPTDRPVVVHVRTSVKQMSAWRQASRELNFPPLPA